MFGKHPLGIFWVVLFQNKMGFCQTKSKKIKIKKIFYCSYIWPKIIRLFKHIFKEEIKILWHVFFLKIAWILQQVYKISKDFGLYLKIIFGKKILFTFNIITRDSIYIIHF